MRYPHDNDNFLIVRNDFRRFLVYFQVPRDDPRVVVIMLLCAAVEFGQYDLVVSLLESGFDVNASKMEPSPMPLHIACAKREKRHHIIRTLLQHGADVHMRGITQMEGNVVDSALTIAVKQDDVQLLEMLMDSCIRNSQKEHHNLGHQLCLHGSDNHRHLTHPIHVAAGLGSLKCLKYLLARDCTMLLDSTSPGSPCDICSAVDVLNMVDAQHQSNLMLGIHDLEVTRELISQGADVTITNNYGQTALWLLMNSYREFNPKTMGLDISDRVALLLQSSADISEQHEGRCLLSALYSNLSRGIVYAPDQYNTEQWSQVFIRVTNLILDHKSTIQSSGQHKEESLQSRSRSGGELSTLDSNHKEAKDNESQPDCESDAMNQSCQFHVNCLMTLVDELRNTVLYFPRRETANYPSDGLGSIEVIFSLIEVLFNKILQAQNYSCLDIQSQLLDRLTLVMFLNDRYNISDTSGKDWTPVLQSVSNIILEALRAGYKLQSTESLCKLLHSTCYEGYDEVLETFLNVLPHAQYAAVCQSIHSNRKVFATIGVEPRPLLQQAAMTIRQCIKKPIVDNRIYLGLPSLIQQYI